MGFPRRWRRLESCRGRYRVRAIRQPWLPQAIEPAIIPVQRILPRPDPDLVGSTSHGVFEFAPWRHTEEFRQVVGTVRDTEHRSVWLQGEASIERPGINSVESEPIDELHDRGDRGRVIAR